MIPGSDDTHTAIGPRSRRVRLAGDATAVAWALRALRAAGIEATEDPGVRRGGEGPIVWVVRPGVGELRPPAARPDPAVPAVPCLVVVPPGGRLPDTLEGAGAVESFDIVREPDDAAVLALRIERLLLLHRRKTQTEIVLHNLSDVVYTRTFEGMLTSINAAGERLFGRRRDDLIGHSVDEVANFGLPADALARTNAELHATGRTSSRLVYQDAVGRRRVFDREGMLLRDGHGRPVGVQVILTDVTEELAARERLERESERNEVLAGIASAARDSLDLSRILESATALLGERLTAHSIRVWLFDEEKRTCVLVRHWRRDDDIPLLEGLSTNLAEDPYLARLCETLEPEVVRDASREDAGPFLGAMMPRIHAAALAAVPIHREGEVIGLLGLGFRSPQPFPNDELVFFRRVADQLALAIRAARLYARLERQVAELAEAQRQRDEADRGRERISAMLVHDLKNPLSAVTAALELTHEKALAMHDERLARMLDGSLASARSLQGLIEDALLVYRPGDAPQPARRPACPKDALAMPLEEARWLAQLRRIRLRVEIADDIPPVPLDVPRFRRAASNLLGNAVKFTPAGGEVVVSAGLRPGRDGERVFFFSVADSGPGVPESLRGRLATPWLRLTEKVPGTGLGLTVVQTVASSHGGSLEVDGRDGGGAVFTMVLPATPLPAAPATAARP